MVISSQGRSVIDCLKSEKIERDYDSDWDWLDSIELKAEGIGILSDEKILISGLHGGGLPLQNNSGESLIYMATEWPIVDIIFQPDG